MTIWDDPPISVDRDHRFGQILIYPKTNLLFYSPPNSIIIRKMPDTKAKGNPPGAKLQNEEEDKPVKINKWDGNAAKNALDDAVRKLITDRFGYVERTHFIDFRLFLATIACSFAGFALLWDWLHPFPKSKPILILCVLAYFALMSVLQLYSMFVEKGTFFVAVDEDPTGTRGDSYWSFSSTMKRFDHVYTLEGAFKSADKKQHGQGQFTRSMSEWFDDEGNLLMDIFATDVYNLHNSLSAGKKEK